MNGTNGSIFEYSNALSYESTHQKERKGHLGCLIYLGMGSTLHN